MERDISSCLLYLLFLVSTKGDISSCPPPLFWPQRREISVRAHLFYSGLCIERYALEISDPTHLLYSGLQGEIYQFLPISFTLASAERDTVSVPGHLLYSGLHGERYQFLPTVSPLFWSPRREISVPTHLLYSGLHGERCQFLPISFILASISTVFFPENCGSLWQTSTRICCAFVYSVYTVISACV